MTRPAATPLDLAGEPETREPDRIAIAPGAAAELGARYRARQQAETRLVDYLAGLLGGLGVDPDRLVGFDDATGELLLVPEADGGA